MSCQWLPFHNNSGLIHPMVTLRLQKGSYFRLHAKEVGQKSLGLVLAGLSKDIYVYIECINSLKMSQKFPLLGNQKEHKRCLKIWLSDTSLN